MPLLLAVCLWLSQDPAHPIVPGYERFGASDGAEGGRLLLGELNCLSCHAPDASAAEHLSLKKAPTLSEAGSRLAPEWIRAFISNPQQSKPGTTMPNVGLSAEEAEALTHFLASLKAAKPKDVGGVSPVKGKDLFNRTGCAACHSPIGGTEIPGSVPLPDLSKKYANPAALARFLADPLAVRPSGRMPRLNLTPAEAMSIATHFITLPPRAPENPAETEPGLSWDVYEGSFGKVPDFDALTPKASGVTLKIGLGHAKRDNDYAIRFRGYFDVPLDGVYTFTTKSDDGSVLRIGSTVVVNNDGIHGAADEIAGAIALKAGRHAFSLGFIQGGGGAELRASVEGPKLSKRELPEKALSRPKSGPPEIREGAVAEAPFTVDPALVQKGRALFAAKRCASCHEAAPDLKAIPSKALASLQDGVCKGVAYPLDAAQVAAIKAALPILAGPRPDPALRAQRTMTALNCYACHERGKRGGPVAERNAHFTTSGDDMGDEGRLPPHLNGVGAKLRREWLQTLLANGSKVRPYMVTRMPVFGPSVAGLAEDFEKADAAAGAALPARSPEQVKAGRLLTGTKGMSCVTCHMFQNHKSLGIPGMDLVHMSQRLRRDWFVKYLLDPPSLRPGTRMPTYWPDGKSVRKDILEGDTAAQIDALWQYLSEGGKAAIPIGIGPQPIPLVPPTGEALIYRNFIQGAGPRAIAVGYPEKAHLAFDAQQLRLALLWRGDFIDASKHWVDRGAGFQVPGGEDVIALTDGAPFGPLAGPWPKATGHEAGYQFGGYELDAKRRPTFLYSFGKLEVRDFLEAVEAKPQPEFRRTITLESKEAPAGLAFRAAASKRIELKDGVYVLENGLRIKVAGPAQLRGGDLLVPLELKDGKQIVELSYAW